MKRVRNLSGLAAMAFLDAMRTIWAGESVDMTPEIRDTIERYLSRHPNVKFDLWQMDEDGDSALFLEEEVYNQDPSFVDWIVATTTNRPLPPPPSAPGGAMKVPPFSPYEPEEISRALVAGLGRFRKRIRGLKERAGKNQLGFLKGPTGRYLVKFRELMTGGDMEGVWVEARFEGEDEARAWARWSVSAVDKNGRRVIPTAWEAKVFDTGEKEGRTGIEISHPGQYLIIPYEWEEYETLREEEGAGFA